MKFELPVETITVKRLRGINLTIAREKAGLSQQGLATLLGWARGWVVSAEDCQA
jgi:DNA-binding transcriptional regulator YiaG